MLPVARHDLVRKEIKWRRKNSRFLGDISFWWIFIGFVSYKMKDFLKCRGYCCPMTVWARINSTCWGLQTRGTHYRYDSYEPPAPKCTYREITERERCSFQELHINWRGLKSQATRPYNMSIKRTPPRSASPSKPVDRSSQGVQFNGKSKMGLPYLLYVNLRSIIPYHLQENLKLVSRPIINLDLSINHLHKKKNTIRGFIRPDN